MDATFLLVFFFLAIWAGFFLFKILMFFKNNKKNKGSSINIKTSRINWTQKMFKRSVSNSNLKTDDTLLYEESYLGNTHIESYEYDYIVKFKNAIIWFDIKDLKDEGSFDKTGTYTKLFYGSKKGSKEINEGDLKAKYLSKVFSEFKNAKFISIIVAVNDIKNTVCNSSLASSYNEKWNIKSEKDLVSHLNILEKAISKNNKNKKFVDTGIFNAIMDKNLLKLTNKQKDQRKEHERTALYIPEL